MDSSVTSTSAPTNRRPTRGGLWRWVVVAIVTGVVAVLVAVGTNLFRPPVSVFNGLPFDPPEPAPDFTLIDQNHRPVHLSDYRGKLTLLYFGFTNCPDQCPITLGIWRQVANLLGDDAEQVRFVLITVDPARDTPEQLEDYLAHFNSDFVGLTGPLDEIEDVAIAYSVYFKEVREEEEANASAMTDTEHGNTHQHDEEESYLIAHTTLTFMIDQTGQLILAYPYNTGAQEIAADLRRLLQ